MSRGPGQLQRLVIRVLNGTYGDYSIKDGWWLMTSPDGAGLYWMMGNLPRIVPEYRQVTRPELRRAIRSMERHGLAETAWFPGVYDDGHCLVRPQKAIRLNSNGSNGHLQVALKQGKCAVPVWARLPRVRYQRDYLGRAGWKAVHLARPPMGHNCRGGTHGR